MNNPKDARNRWAEVLREWNGGDIQPGRNDIPAAFFDLYHSQAFDGDKVLMALALEDAWTSPEFPARLVDEESWIQFFGEFTFLENQTPSEMPATIPVLYRAAAVGHENGMSWTDNYEKAKWFYDRNVSFGNETVMLKLEPNRSEVLAHFHGEGTRDEDEWVVHPAATYNAEEIEVSE